MMAQFPELEYFLDFHIREDNDSHMVLKTAI